MKAACLNRLPFVISATIGFDDAFGNEPLDEVAVQSGVLRSRNGIGQKLRCVLFRRGQVLLLGIGRRRKGIVVLNAVDRSVDHQRERQIRVGVGVG